MGKPISQKRWVKGINPGTGILTQTPGSLQRSSNLLFNQRGSLQTCDGSFLILSLPDGWPFILTLGVYNNYASGSYPFYVLLSDDPATNRLQLFIAYPSTPPIPLAVFLASAGNYSVAPFIPALLAPGDPNFQSAGSITTDYDPSSTTGTVTATSTLTPPSFVTNSIVFSGFPSTALVPGNTVSITLTLNGTIADGAASGIRSSYSLDSGATYTQFDFETGSFGTLPSTTINFTIPTGFANLDTLFIQITAIAEKLNFQTSASTTANITDIFAGVTVSSTLSPYGGVSGEACLIPQILQFTDTTILILGNGLPPQTVDVTLLASATPANLTNTFTANYPPWQSGVDWTTGSQIAVTISGTSYLFTAIQGGISGMSPPTFPAGQGQTVYDNQIIWQNVGVVSTSPAPRGAAHGIVYAGSLWLANTSPATTMDQLDGPTVLKMSDSNNPQSWNPLNVAFIGRDDGTQITGLASFTIAEAGIAPTGSLCVFKEFSTYQIFGVFGATDFQITQAQTDLGCIGPRTIQFLPGYGIARLTHLGFAIFDGVRDRLISEEIRPYIFGGIVELADIIPIDFSFVYFSKGQQSTLPPMYFCICPLAGAAGAMTRLFCYDLVLKAWAIVDLPWPVSALTSVRVGEGKPLLLASRSDNGTVSRIQAGDSQWNAESESPTSINFSAQANDIFLEGSSQRAFYRGLTLRGQVLDPTIPATITTSITLDGQLINPTPIPYFIEPQPGSNQFQLDVDILMNGQIAHVTLVGTGRLIIDSIDWDATPKQGRKVIG